MAWRLLRKGAGVGGGPVLSAAIMLALVPVTRAVAPGAVMAP